MEKFHTNSREFVKVMLRMACTVYLSFHKTTSDVIITSLLRYVMSHDKINVIFGFSESFYIYFGIFYV